MPTERSQQFPSHQKGSESMKLYFLGGAMEIGGSCIYLKIAGRGILLDCGIRQSGTKDPLPDFRTIQEQGGLDAMIISHAHMDHIGTLPIISKAYPGARIYMTAMTADLTRVLLYDSLKIMNSREDEIPHYSEPDVRAMLNRIYAIGYQMPFPIFDNFTLSFFPAGHIAGASCVYLTTEEGSLFYTGDFSAFPQRTIDGIRIPRLRPDIVIAETTYGNRLHANRQVEEKRLIDLVRECILQKKKILIPAFALGRAQEVLLILRSAIQNQEIPPVPVYVDGMVRDINTMYTRNPTYLRNALGKRVLKGNEPFYTQEIQPVAPNQNRKELLSGKEPAVFLSSSGMLTGGPSVWYAAELASSEDACIIITGYQDEESPGRQLLNLLDRPDSENASLTLNGTVVPVRCRIEQVGLSAHGDKSEITALLESLSPRNIFLVHGNPEGIRELGAELTAGDYRRQVYLPECGQTFELSLHAKRKQQAFLPPRTLQMDRLFTREDEKLLWDFWQKYYPGKTFSLSQIAYLWYGKTPEAYRDPSSEAIREKAAGQLAEDAAGFWRTRNEEEENPRDVVLESMQNLLLTSPYFTPNARRLFLIEANTPEAAAEALAPRELTQQKLADKIQAVFGDYNYRKISYHNEKQEVMLQFDYPDSQDTENFLKKATAFTNATGWTIQISPSVNHNAAALLLSTLFGERITKTSYYPEKKCYSVTVAKPCETAPSASSEEQWTDKDAAEKFHAVTGWGLIINGEPPAGFPASGSGSQQTGEDFFLPAPASPAPIEQNLAFSCIEQAFSRQKHKPDKKSLKQDSRGKYLEIGFISPMVGRRYQETLQQLSDRTGWRLRIADKVSQNELIRISQLLCLKFDITLTKNPSYLPDRKIIQLKTQDTVAPDIQEKIAEKFRDMTGCDCIF